jgi:hypothetical protein
VVSYSKTILLNILLLCIGLVPNILLLSDENLYVFLFSIQPSDSALPVPLTDAEITDIVALHNKYRGQVNAKFMMKLYWDPELMKIAQAHANMCAFEHDIAPNRVSPLYGWFHGQNMVMATDITTPPANLADIMFSSEQARFTYGVACTADNSCSHYTQLMLAGMTRMGCGQTHCLYPHGYERFLVCNYIHSQYDDTAVKPYEEGNVLFFDFIYLYELFVWVS